jgi:uracil-DNA glycosylase family protein
MAKRKPNAVASDTGEPTSPNGAADFFPAKPTLPAAREVGETPGDREDIVGRPFVGPAGQLLDRALDAAGIDRKAVYVTNVVKHFKWEPRGKRRLHKRPLPSEIGACMPWLAMEIELVRPEILVCLGATAGQALFGKSFSVMRERGRFLASRHAPFVLATVHPSALLRIRESDERHEAFERFVADLALVNDAGRKTAP